MSCHRSQVLGDTRTLSWTLLALAALVTRYFFVIKLFGGAQRSAMRGEDAAVSAMIYLLPCARGLWLRCLGCVVLPLTEFQI